MPDADRVRANIPRQYRRLFSALADESSPSDAVKTILIEALRDDIKASGEIVLMAVHRFGALFEEAQRLPLLFSGKRAVEMFDSIPNTLNSLSKDVRVDKETIGLLEQAAYRTLETLISGRASVDYAQTYARLFVKEVFQVKIEGNLHLAVNPTIAANHLKQIKSEVLTAAERLGDQLPRITTIEKLRLPPNTRARLTLGLNDALPLGDGV